MDTRCNETSLGAELHKESCDGNMPGQSWRYLAVTAFAAVAVFVMALSTPVTIDPGASGFDVVAPAKAYAKGGNGGGGGGGNGNGRGNNGGNGRGKGKGGSEGGDDIVLLPMIPTVTIAVFTTEIKKRYPANDVTELDDPYQAISFFSELYAMTGKKITHRWTHDGEIRFQASFQVLAQRWRVWSTQLLPAELPGEWTVEVVDEKGKILGRRSIVFRPAAGT